MALTQNTDWLTKQQTAAHQYTSPPPRCGKDIMIMQVIVVPYE